MRRFPDVYIPGYREKLDPIRAWDLNELQRQGMLNFLGAASTRERLIVDEFAGDTLNRAIWADNVDKPAAPADDSANGGFGAVRFNSAPGTPKLLYTNCAIPAGALNYSLAIRVRVASRGATYRFRFGLVDDVTLGNGRYIGFQQDANSGNWLVGGLGPGWSSIAPTSTYQVLEYHKRDRWASWSIDGVEIAATDVYYEGANGGDRVYHDTGLPFYIYSDNTIDAYVDSVSIWLGETIADGVNRRGAQDWRSTGEAEINTPAHHESKVATLSAVTSTTVTWDKPFEGEYRVYPSVQAAAAVSWAITAKSATGITVTFSAAVTGTLTVDAREVI